MSGRIVLAATPIGNLGDASPRLWEVLRDADVVAAEDTRVTRELAAAGGVRLGGELIALHDHNEAEAAARVVVRAEEGALVVVVSDAGMPTVSDPGYRVVTAAIARGVEVSVVPGPSAALAALAVSGLPTDRFAFEGFVPRKGGQRADAFAALVAERRTLVFFESPHRIAATLADMAAAFGADRAASVSRELTKKFEQTVRGPLGELAAWARDEAPRGEIVVVVAGVPAGAASMDDLVAEALARVDAGERAKDVCGDLAGAAGVPQRELYAAVLEARARRG